MIRFAFRTGLAVVALAVGMSVHSAGFPSNAHADASNPAQQAPNQPTGKPCRTLWVQLHGTAPATATCLDNRTPIHTSHPGVDIYQDTGCTQNALWLYQDTNDSGLRICFRGAGSVNLGNYVTSCNFGICASWNDNASSYWGGCSTGRFYHDSNETGQYYDYGVQEQHNFDGSLNVNNNEYRLGNDTLSSLTIWSGC